jgi:hypothetical protein
MERTWVPSHDLPELGTAQPQPHLWFRLTALVIQFVEVDLSSGRGNSN